MCSEAVLHAMSQLVYLDVVPRLLENGAPTVGMLADYYTKSPVGALYLKARFCGVSGEYESWGRFLAEGVLPYRDFRILHILSDNAANGSGFFGCAFDTGEAGLIVAFRGSEMLGDPAYKNDYRTNLGLAYLEKTPQQELVDHYLLRYMEPLRRPFAVVGHSLGGNLAVYAAVRVPKRLLESVTGCYAFNAPGFSDEFIQAHKAGIAAAKLVLYQNRLDPVSSLLKSIAEPVLLETSFDPHADEALTVGSLFYPHSNFAFLWDGDKLVRSKDTPKSDFCRGVQTLSNLFMKLPRTVRRDVCKLLLELLYLPVSPRRELLYLLERVLKRLGNTPEAGDSSGWDLHAAIHGARLLATSPTAFEQLLNRLRDTAKGGVSASDTALLLLHGLQVSCARRD